MSLEKPPDVVHRVAPGLRYSAPPADPVADVLDWLGRYDLRFDIDNDTWDNNDVCDEIPGEEATGSKGVVGRSLVRDDTTVQPLWSAPQLGQPGGSVLGCPGRGPGRLLRPSDPPPAAAGSALATSSSQPQVGKASTAAPPPSGSSAAASSSTAAQPARISRTSLPRRPLGDVCAQVEKGRDIGVCCQEEHKRDNFFFEEEEEEEWDQRQRKSGTVGRLVVYHEGESPKEDVVLRGGGSRRHIVVAGIREGGQAARVGVRAGDRLVSINGQKDFLGLTADAVRERLDSPCVLVFLGFVGKLQAEVRLTYTDQVCGMSTRAQVAHGSNTAPVKLCEERVFDAGIASLFMAVGDIDDESEEERRPGSAQPRQQLFELQRSDACGLVRRALRRMEVKELLSKASANFIEKASGYRAASLPTPAHGDSGTPSALSPSPPSPPPVQALGPVAAAAEPAPPPPMQPGASAGEGAPWEAREATGTSSDMVVWEAETSDALTRALFREDVSPLALMTSDDAAASQEKPRTRQFERPSDSELNVL